MREVGITDHAKNITKFEKAGKDVKLKAWIAKTLPHLREHLVAARKLPQSGSDASAMGTRGAGPAGGNLRSTPKSLVTGRQDGQLGRGPTGPRGGRRHGPDRHLLRMVAARQCRH